MGALKKICFSVMVGVPLLVSNRLWQRRACYVGCMGEHASRVRGKRCGAAAALQGLQRTPRHRLADSRERH